jgi:hypothetical protein
MEATAAPANTIERESPQKPEAVRHIVIGPDRARDPRENLEWM